MNVNRIQNNQPHTTFQAKVSEKFIDSMRNFINHGENRLKNNYKFNEKLKEYETFGYDDYTIIMHKKSGALGFEYRLFAIKDDEPYDQGVVLTKKTYNSFRQIFNRFMNFNKHDFRNIMNKNTKKSVWYYQTDFFAYSLLFLLI